MARVVLVTGAARRVGAALARGLAADGWTVAVHHRGGADEAGAVAEAIRAEGGAAETFAADLAIPAQRDALIPAVVARFGRIDALINNASLFHYDTLQTLTEASWRDHVDANLTAPVFLIRDFAAAVETAGGEGCVVNILDHKINAPNPDFFAYTAGKVGLAGLTQTLALALAPRVRLNGIAPGLILPSWDQSEADFERAWRDAPLQRGSGLEDVLGAVRYVLAAPSLTGQNLVVDGGESLTRRGRDMAFDPSLRA